MLRLNNKNESLAIHTLLQTMTLTVLTLIVGTLAGNAYAENCQQVRAQYNCPAGEEKYPLHLSFDDGPADVTELVLDALKKENIPATFFIIAKRLECAEPRQQCQSLTGEEQITHCERYQQCLDRRQTMKRTLAEGHIIGSHSYEHERHSQIPPQQMKDYISRSKQLLAPFLNTTPPVFRLPYGDGYFNQITDPEVMQELTDQGFKHIGWEMSAFDWRKSDQKDDKILQTVMKEICTKKRGIILFHDGVHDQEHVGRTFTAHNLASWLPKMRCVADFKPLTHFIRGITVK